MECRPSHRFWGKDLRRLKAQTRALIGTAAVLAGAAAILPVQADTPGRLGIVCWNDDRGQRVCGDHVSPEYARKQREIYDSRGVLVQTLKAEETPEQRAEDERKQREALRLQQQQQNDTFMLQTYRNVADLKAVRDSRLQSLDTRIELAQTAVDKGAASLKDLQDRVEADRSAGKEDNPELLGQVKSFENSQTENVRALAQLKQDRENAATQFERDILRFQQLRGETTPLPPPTPAAPPTPPAPPPSTAPRP